MLPGVDLFGSAGQQATGVLQLMRRKWHAHCAVTVARPALEDGEQQ
jgi:hypothetical protein